MGRGVCLLWAAETSGEQRAPSTWETTRPLQFKGPSGEQDRGKKLQKNSAGNLLHQRLVLLQNNKELIFLLS